MKKQSETEKGKKTDAKVSLPKDQTKTRTRKNAKKTESRKVMSRFSLTATVALIAGLILGGAFIVLGANGQIASEHPSVPVRAKDEIQSDIDESYKQIDELREKRNSIKDTESTEYAEVSASLANAESDRANYEQEMARASSEKSVTPKVEATFNGAPLIIIGSAIVALGVGFSYYLSMRNKTEARE